MGCCIQKDDLLKYNINFPNPKTSRALHAGLNKHENVGDDKSSINTKSLNRNDSILTVSVLKRTEKMERFFASNGQNVSEIEIKKNIDTDAEPKLQENHITFNVVESIEYQATNNNHKINRNENNDKENELFLPQILHLSKSLMDIHSRSHDQEIFNLTTLHHKHNSCKSLTRPNSLASSPKTTVKDKILRRCLTARVRAKYENGSALERNVNRDNGNSILSKDFACLCSLPQLDKDADCWSFRKIPKYTLSPAIKNDLEKGHPNTFNLIPNSAKNARSKTIKIVPETNNNSISRLPRSPYGNQILEKYHHLFTDSQKQQAKSQQTANRHYDKRLINTEGDITNLKNRTASNSMNYSGYQSGHTSFWHTRQHTTDLNLVSIHPYISINDLLRDTISETK